MNKNNLNDLIIEHLAFFQVLRILTACILAFIIDQAFQLPYGTWAPITIIVVMSANYSGAVSSKANQRIIGTAIGALLGLTLYLLPNSMQTLHYILLLIMLSASLFFTLGKYSYSAILASVTLILVAGFGPGDLHIALWRTTNVIWGGLLAILCSKFLFPAKAENHFKALCVKFLVEFHGIYDQHNRNASQDKEYTPIDLSKCKAIVKQLASLEASGEQENPKNKIVMKSILGCQTRMFSLLESITQTPWRHQYGHKKIQSLCGLFEAKNQMAFLIETLSNRYHTHQACLIDTDQLSILDLYPEIDGDVITDISFYGYLWLNRELARQLSLLSKYLNQFE